MNAKPALVAYLAALAAPHGADGAVPLPVLRREFAAAGWDRPTTDDILRAWAAAGALALEPGPAGPDALVVAGAPYGAVRAA